jgi:hypothetical protein
MVGETGFEPATLCSQSRCATRLRYSPTSVVKAYFSARCQIKMRKSVSATAPPCGHAIVIRLALPPAAVVLIEVVTSSQSHSSR